VNWLTKPAENTYDRGSNQKHFYVSDCEPHHVAAAFALIVIPCGRLTNLLFLPHCPAFRAGPFFDTLAKASRTRVALTSDDWAMLERPAERNQEAVAPISGPALMVF
jgi:hypothetical protein